MDIKELIDLLTEKQGRLYVGKEEKAGKWNKYKYSASITIPISLKEVTKEKIIELQDIMATSIKDRKEKDGVKDEVNHEK